MKNTVVAISDPNSIFEDLDSDTILAIQNIFPDFLDDIGYESSHFAHDQINQFDSLGTLPKILLPRLRTIANMLQDVEVNEALLNSFRVTMKRLLRKNASKVNNDESFQLPTANTVEECARRARVIMENKARAGLSKRKENPFPKQ